MKPKPLSETNPYLKNLAERRRLIARSTRTSGGVEGIKISSSQAAHILIKRRKDKKIYKLSKPIAPTK